MLSWSDYVKKRVAGGISNTFNYVWTDASSGRDVVWRLIKSPFKLTWNSVLATGRFDMFALPGWVVAAVSSNYYTTVPHNPTALTGITGAGMVITSASSIASSFDATTQRIDEAIMKYKKLYGVNINRKVLKELEELRTVEQWKAVALMIVVAGGVSIYALSSFGILGKTPYLISCIGMPLAIAFHRIIQQPRIENGSIEHTAILNIHEIFSNANIVDLEFVRTCLQRDELADTSESSVLLSLDTLRKSAAAYAEDAVEVDVDTFLARMRDDEHKYNSEMLSENEQTDIRTSATILTTEKPFDFSSSPVPEAKIGQQFDATVLALSKNMDSVVGQVPDAVQTPSASPRTQNNKDLSIIPSQPAEATIRSSQTLDIATSSYVQSVAALSFDEPLAQQPSTQMLYHYSVHAAKPSEIQQSQQDDPIKNEVDETNKMYIPNTATVTV